MADAQIEVRTQGGMRVRLTPLELAALIAATQVADDQHTLAARAKLVRAFVKAGGTVKDGLPLSHDGPNLPGEAQ